MIKESGFITLPIAIFFSAIILSGSAFFIVKKVDNRDIKNESENNIEEIFLVDEISIDNETESDIDVSKPAIDTKDSDSLKTVVQTKKYPCCKKYTRRIIVN